MFRYRLRQARDGIRRLLRVTTLEDQNALMGELKSLNARLDTFSQAMESEVGRWIDSRLGQRLDELESRLVEKVAVLSRPDADELATGLKGFLEMLRLAGLDRWKIREYEGLLRYLRRQDYLAAIRDGRLVVPRLETDHPLALYSNDTRFPRGSKNDNSILGRFNRKLYQFLGDREGLRVLDLGCAGGGFVRSILDDGHFAVGLEGSDYPLLNQAGEWSTIPQHLFTCDITKPFRLTEKNNGEPLLFDAVTAWEVMEHIPEDGLEGLFENIEEHLAPGGHLLFSVATFLDWDERTGTVWHSTVKPREWWRGPDRFARLGFRVEEEHPFGKDDWLRGSGQCRGDWHEDQGLGFHIVLRRQGDAASAAAGARRWQAAVA